MPRKVKPEHEIGGEPKARRGRKKKPTELQAQLDAEESAKPFLIGKSRDEKRETYNSLITGNKEHALAVFKIVLQSPSNLGAGREIMAAIRNWVATNDPTFVPD